MCLELRGIPRCRAGPSMFSQASVVPLTKVAELCVVPEGSPVKKAVMILVRTGSLGHSVGWVPALHGSQDMGESAYAVKVWCAPFRCKADSPLGILPVPWVESGGNPRPHVVTGVQSRLTCRFMSQRSPFNIG